MIVDSHAHIISPEASAYPHTPVGGLMPDWYGQRETPSAERLLELMAAAGVDRASAARVLCYSR